MSAATNVAVEALAALEMEGVSVLLLKCVIVVRNCSSRNASRKKGIRVHNGKVIAT
jgi:hypothetical protein